MIEPLKILDEDSKPEFDYKEAYKNCFVDLSKEPKRPEIVLSIGSHDYKGVLYPNPTLTVDEMSVIVAPKKSKKSFLKASLCACYIGGNAQHYFPDIRSHRVGEPYILDFDTEQGQYYAWRSFNTVAEMVGHKYHNYLPFGLKKLSKKERLLFIDSTINDPRYKGKIGLILIDGIVDLIANPNSYEESDEVIMKLMQWNSGAHIINVIHKTFEKAKANGHAGTIIQNKIETSFFLEVTEKDVKNSPVKVEQTDSRGAPFDDFYFDLDLTTVLPKQCGVSEDWEV
tara:strand:+ start:1262 stop:2113 length:852 start_codon:yes stop_codon:yes gene_type:complete